MHYTCMQRHDTGAFNEHPCTQLFAHLYYTYFFPTVNCSDPTFPTNGSIEAYQNTTEGAEIFFRCNPMFVPAGRMRAACTSDGRWNPDPAGHRCTCKVMW